MHFEAHVPTTPYWVKCRVQIKFLIGILIQRSKKYAARTRNIALTIHFYDEHELKCNSVIHFLFSFKEQFLLIILSFRSKRKTVAITSSTMFITLFRLSFE